MLNGNRPDDGMRVFTQTQASGLCTAVENQAPPSLEVWHWRPRRTRRKEASGNLVGRNLGNPSHPCRLRGSKGRKIESWQVDAIEFAVAKAHHVGKIMLNTTEGFRGLRRRLQARLAGQQAGRETKKLASAEEKMEIKSKY